MTAEEFDYLVPYLRALCQGKKVERKFTDEPDVMWTPCYFEKMISMRVIPGMQFRIAEPPLECWMNVYSSGVQAFNSKQEAIDSLPKIAYYANNEQPTRIAVHMREVIE